MINLQIREFSQTIINFVNQSPLSIEIKRLCINDIAAQLQSAAEMQIQRELQARNQAEGQEVKDELEKDTSNNSVEK